jgi:hypothetical protein
VFAIAAVVALGAAAAACVRPVRRLAGTDPKVALTSE